MSSRKRVSLYFMKTTLLKFQVRYSTNYSLYSSMQLLLILISQLDGPMLGDYSLGDYVLANASLLSHYNINGERL